ncbi:MAG: preprotein translocase subunit Sec61beta [archaeon]|nr:preprotein translocase subunit Sec61beta [archaeon]
MKFNSSPQSSGPSSSIGIMRFFDTDTGGPKMSPEFVVGVTVAFTVIVIVFHLMG